MIGGPGSHRPAGPRRAARRAWIALLPLAAGCVSTSDVESIQSQLADIQRQVLQVQRQGSGKEDIAELGTSMSDQMQTLLKAEADMRLELQSLSAQIEQLQARLEDTNYRLSQLSQQIAATNQELKTFRASGTPGGDPSAALPAQPADPQSVYQAAYSDYLRKNYDLAILGFRQYLETFPDTDLADNAAYWIGESYFSQGKFRQAVQEFDTVLTRYPRSDKTASAWLKKGYAYLELGERSQGVVQLQHVLREYPGSDEANLARQRLRDLGVDVR